jgi:hypothetical protein
MAYERYRNLTKLVISLEILLSPSISKSQLKLAQKILEEFVSELEELYSPAIMLSGVHELLHLVNCTFYLGPLNLINGFEFEELNRKIVSFIHSYDLCGEEFIKIFSTAQVLSCYKQLLQHFLPSNNKNIINYLQENCFKTSNAKRLKYYDDEIKINKQHMTLLDNEILKSCQSKFLNETITYLVSDIVCYRGVRYTNLSTQVKRCDFCVETKNGQLGLIKTFLFYENVCYVVAKKVQKLYCPFFSDVSNLRIKSKLVIVHETDEIIIEKIKHVKKVSFIKLNDSLCFVSGFSTSHLFN